MPFSRWGEVFGDATGSEDWIDAAVLGLATTASEGSREFSDHELEIITRSLRGQRPSQIAAELYLNRGTVRSPLSAHYRRFNVRSRTALIAAIVYGQHGAGS